MVLIIDMRREKGFYEESTNTLVLGYKDLGRNGPKEKMLLVYGFLLGQKLSKDYLGTKKPGVLAVVYHDGKIFKNTLVELLWNNPGEKALLVDSVDILKLLYSFVGEFEDLPSVVLRYMGLFDVVSGNVGVIKPKDIRELPFLLDNPDMIKDKIEGIGRKIFGKIKEVIEFLGTVLPAYFFSATYIGMMRGYRNEYISSFLGDFMNEIQKIKRIIPYATLVVDFNEISENPEEVNRVIDILKSTEIYVYGKPTGLQLVQLFREFFPRMVLSKVDREDLLRDLLAGDLERILKDYPGTGNIKKLLDLFSKEKISKEIWTIDGNGFLKDFSKSGGDLEKFPLAFADEYKVRLVSDLEKYSNVMFTQFIVGRYKHGKSTEIMKRIVQYLLLFGDLGKIIDAVKKYTNGKTLLELLEVRKDLIINGLRTFEGASLTDIGEEIFGSEEDIEEFIKNIPEPEIPENYR